MAISGHVSLVTISDKFLFYFLLQISVIVDFVDNFIEISQILVLVSAVSFVVRLLKQPLIVGYIFTGMIVGPFGLSLISSNDNLELFSKIGIACLLFIVGLSLSPKVIKEVGKASLITGVGQVLFTSIIGFAIARMLGITPLAALYVSIALTFSSTIIILKLLSDRGDLDKLYGKVAIGFLLIQDIVATIVLLLVSAGGNSSEPISVLIFTVLGKGAIVLLGLWLLGMKVLPAITRFAAGSSELLFVFSLAWGLGLGGLFHLIGFSLEIGTLIAGVVMSTTPFASEMSSRMKPLRDFFIILFFVLLGSQMILDTIPQIILPAVVLSAFVLIGNPVIVIILMNILGFRRRTSFMAGLTVAQISEFSLILATLGFSLGHLSKEVLSLITLVGLITITGSTYLILFADGIYKKINRALRFLELKHSSRENAVGDESYDAILFGYGRVGEDYIKSFQSLGLNYLVIDHDPSVAEKLLQTGVKFRFGDLEEFEFLEELPLSRAKLVVAGIPDHGTTQQLVNYVRGVNSKCVLIAISNNVNQALELYQAGASYVIMPHYLGASYGVSLIRKIGLDNEALIVEREKHFKFLETRHTK